MDGAMPPDDLGFIDEDERIAEHNRKLDRLDILAAGLMTKAREYSAARSIKENQWLEDTRQYNGLYDAGTEARLLNSKKSRVFLGLTRSKTNTAESRVADMLFPSDDRNWEIAPTPVPEMVAGDPEDPATDEESGQPIVDDETGQQLTAKDVATARAEQQRAEAKKRADAMQAEIDDQLTEAKYAMKAREAIHQACVLGTGVLKGPIVVGRTRKAWTAGADGSWTLEVLEELRPSVEFVDVWNFYPDLSVLRFEDGEGCFERLFYSKRQLMDLRKNPYYIIPNLESVLEMMPSETRNGIDYLQQLRQIHGAQALVSDTRYEGWVWNGQIRVGDLRDAGVPLEEHLGDDDTVFGAIEMCGKRVIRAFVNPLTSGDLPYSVYNYERDETCVLGFGVPHLMRDPQRVVNAAWRMLNDNLGLSVAPQVVINSGLVRPADGNWSLRAGKEWLLEDSSRSVNEVFGTFKIDACQVELTALLKDGMALMDETTNLPLIAQGQQTPLTRTAEGMAMLMNAANTVLRRAVKEWDDGVTAGMISRFYHWNMEYNKKSDIKGDFEVDARGASVLLAKEIQAQNIMQLAANFVASPVFGPMFKPLSVIRKVVQSQHLSADDLVITDAEYAAKQKQAQEAAQNGQQDPKMAAAQFLAESKMKELEYERDTKAMIAQADREIEILRLATDQKMSVEKLKTMLAIKQIGAETDMALLNQETRVKAAFGSGI